MKKSELMAILDPMEDVEIVVFEYPWMSELWRVAEKNGKIMISLGKKEVVEDD